MIILGILEQIFRIIWDFFRVRAGQQRLFSFQEIYQIREKRFFFGMLLTIIFLVGPDFPGRNLLTWRPTLIRLVRAPCGKTAWTWGTTVEDTIPPSGPTAWTSWRIRETRAKYWGKSVVSILVIRLVFRSSNCFRSVKLNIESNYLREIQPLNTQILNS